MTLILLLHVPVSRCFHLVWLSQGRALDNLKVFPNTAIYLLNFLKFITIFLLEIILFEFFPEEIIIHKYHSLRLRNRLRFQLNSIWKRHRFSFEQVETKIYGILWNFFSQWNVLQIAKQISWGNPPYKMTSANLNFLFLFHFSIHSTIISPILFEDWILSGIKTISDPRWHLITETRPVPESPGATEN